MIAIARKNIESAAISGARPMQNSPAYHQNRTAGVVDHRMRDTAHQRAPQGPEAAASQNDEPRSKLLGQTYDLCIGPTGARVRPGYLAPTLLYPLHLLVESRLRLLLDALLGARSRLPWP